MSMYVRLQTDGRQGKKIGEIINKDSFSPCAGVELTTTYPAASGKIKHELTIMSETGNIQSWKSNELSKQEVVTAVSISEYGRILGIYTLTCNYAKKNEIYRKITNEDALKPEPDSCQVVDTEKMAKK